MLIRSFVFVFFYSYHYLDWGIVHIVSFHERKKKTWHTPSHTKPHSIRMKWFNVYFSVACQLYNSFIIFFHIPCGISHYCITYLFYFNLIYLWDTCVFFFFSLSLYFSFLFFFTGISFIRFVYTVEWWCAWALKSNSGKYQWLYVYTMSIYAGLHINNLILSFVRRICYFLIDKCWLKWAMNGQANECSSVQFQMRERIEQMKFVQQNIS